MQEKNAKATKIIVFIITFGIIGFFMIYFADFFISLTSLEVRQELRNQVSQMGIWGWFLVFGIQFVQVFIAFLPSEPVELLMGMIYGTWGGLWVGLVGVFLGTIFSYYLAKWVGVPFFKLFIKKNYFEKLEFLQDEKKVAISVFIAYLMVGVPSDVVTYLGPTLKIKPWKFFLLSTIARIPKIVTSTFVGHHLVEGNIVLSIVIFVGTGLLSLISVFVGRQLTKKKKPVEEKGAPDVSNNLH